eukprot:SAG31_NODE_744_length_12415_cov_74.120900_2_plen_1183_part_00
MLAGDVGRTSVRERLIVVPLACRRSVSLRFRCIGSILPHAQVQTAQALQSTIDAAREANRAAIATIGQLQPMPLHSDDQHESQTLLTALSDPPSPGSEKTARGSEELASTAHSEPPAVQPDSTRSDCAEAAAHTDTPSRSSSAKMAGTERPLLVTAQGGDLTETETLTTPINATASDAGDGLPALPSPCARDGQVKMADLQVVDWLGKGAVGRVYLVRQISSGELYAVKALSKRAMLSKKKGVAHVMQEFDILRSAAHPFVIKLYASFQSVHHLCHLMEFCPRGHFYSLLQSQPYKRLPEAAARFYAAEILSGIEYLHIQGFIYRDMKPENILVAASGHLRLTDFDLSQTADEAATTIKADGGGIGVSQKVHDLLMAQQEHEDASLKVAAATSGRSNDPSATSAPGLNNYARFDSFVGTIEYMAPEVVQGTGHSFTVDWWIYGCMLYEMVTGVTPFRGKDAKATFDKILNSEPSWAHPLCLEPRPKVSKELKDIIKKLLVKVQSKRLGYDQGAAAIKKQPWFSKDGILMVSSVANPDNDDKNSSAAVGLSGKTDSTLPGLPLTSSADTMQKVSPVRWDLLRNEQPPMLPLAKTLDDKVYAASSGDAVPDLKQLEEVLEQLDSEELAQLAKKAKEDAEKAVAAAGDGTKGKGGGSVLASATAAAKKKANPPQTRAQARAAARVAAANAPERLVGFAFDARDGVTGGAGGRRDAYGGDETGTARLVATMKEEAQRRAAARLPLHIPAKHLLFPANKTAAENDFRRSHDANDTNTVDSAQEDAIVIADRVWERLGLALGPAPDAGGGLVVLSILTNSLTQKLQPALVPGCQLVSVQGTAVDSFGLLDPGEDGSTPETANIKAGVSRVISKAISELGTLQSFACGAVDAEEEAVNAAQEYGKLSLVFLTAEGAEAEARQQTRLRISVSARQSRQFHRGGVGNAPDGISFADVIAFDEEKAMSEALQMLAAAQYQQAGRAFAAVLRMTESVELQTQAKRGLEQARKGVALAMLSPEELMAMLPSAPSGEVVGENENEATDDVEEQNDSKITLHDHLGLSPLEEPSTEDQTARGSGFSIFRGGTWFGRSNKRAGDLEVTQASTSPTAERRMTDAAPDQVATPRRSRFSVARLVGKSLINDQSISNKDSQVDGVLGEAEGGIRMSFDGGGESGVRMSFDSDESPFSNHK